jgi:hypothetical protein
MNALARPAALSLAAHPDDGSRPWMQALVNAGRLRAEAGK